MGYVGGTTGGCGYRYVNPGIVLVLFILLVIVLRSWYPF